MSKFLKYFFWGLAVLFLLVLLWVFLVPVPKPEKIFWGIDFSQKHSRDMGLDWKENYTAILDDLKARDLKVAVYWDLVETERGVYDFSDIDWQMEEAEKRQARVILITGLKTSRWPECHMPGWAGSLSQAEQQEAILAQTKALVLRYKDSPSLYAWQPENEALFLFGECPWTDKEFLKKEADLVRQLDPGHPVEISDSGEGSVWFDAAKIGDTVGITMYREVWTSPYNFYFTYPLPPSIYYYKSKLVEALYGKEVWCIELQAEPWCPVLLYDCPVIEQKKTMNAEKFKKNIEFAKKTGLGHFYLWGAEWMYWMKVKQGDPSVWNEAKTLFTQN